MVTNEYLKENRHYSTINLLDKETLFDGWIDDYEVPLDIKKRLSKDIGFSYDLYMKIKSVSDEAANTFLDSILQDMKDPSIVLLLDDDLKSVLGYSLDPSRYPLLHKDFITRAKSLVDSCDEISIDEIYYSLSDPLSTVLIKKINPIKIEEKYQEKDSLCFNYNIGVLLVNDEINPVYAKLVVYVEGQPLYLPATYYNTTTARYRRSTSSSSEAMEMIMLKIIDDLRDEGLHDKIYDFHMKYRYSKKALLSYEEYETAMKTLKRIPTIIEEDSYLDKMTRYYEGFLQQYNNLEDKRSSYIWRCTALGEIEIGALISSIIRVLNDMNAPSLEYFSIRELLGLYASTPRIIGEIANH